MTADNWKPQKYLSQQPRDMRFLPFETDEPPSADISEVLIVLMAVGVAVLLFAGVI